MKFAELLDLAKMSAEDLPDGLEAANTELHAAISEAKDIRTQIECERDGLSSRSVNDHTWIYRAQHALRMANAKVNVLKRHVNRLKEEEGKQRRLEKEKRRRQNELDRVAAEKRRKAKRLAHEARLETEAEITVRAFKNVIKTLPEDLQRRFWVAANAALEEFRKEDQCAID